VLDALTFANHPEDVIFLAAPLRWYQLQDRLPHNFVRLVAKYAFRTEIPRCDNAIEVLAHDGIIGVVDNGGEPSDRIQSKMMLSHFQRRAIETTGFSQQIMGK
jgi:hypothetical protein